MTNLKFGLPYFGLLGGFVGALAMGSVVPLPDALCLTLASYAVREVGGSIFWLGLIVHEITGGIIGVIFGIVVSRINGLRNNSVVRTLVIGVVTGILVWTVFFTPSMLAVVPSLLSGGLIVASFVAHIVFGVVLNGTVRVLSLRR